MHSSLLEAQNSGLPLVLALNNTSVLLVSSDAHWVCAQLQHVPFSVLQAVKAVKTLQEETSEDFSSTDEWQTAKARLRR